MRLERRGAGNIMKSRKETNLKFITEAPHSSEPIVAMCELEGIAIIATKSALYAMGRADKVDVFVKNFTVRSLPPVSPEPTPGIRPETGGQKP